MAEPEKKPQFLPYRTTKEKFEAVIDALRASPKSKDAVNIAAGASDAQFVLKNLVTLGLVNDVSAPELTEAGRAIAYSNGDERCKAILKSLLAFQPYKAVLVDAATKKVESLTVSDIASIWGQKDIGADDNARSSGAIVLAALMESAGLGNYSLGRRGKPSRISLAQGWHARLMAGLGGPGLAAPASSPDPQPIPATIGNGSLNRVATPPSPPGFVRHSFQLRRGMVIEVQFPEDLTAKEVERFTTWCSSLPLPLDEGS